MIKLLLLISIFPALRRYRVRSLRDKPALTGILDPAVHYHQYSHLILPHWDWDSQKHTGGHTFETYVGAKEKFSFANDLSVFGGLKEKIVLGGALTFNFIEHLKFYWGFKQDIALCKTWKYNLIAKGPSIIEAPFLTMKGKIIKLG